MSNLKIPPQATILMGLPLSGKTTWINNNIPEVQCISADKIKEAHPDYDPERSHLLHEYSVKEAERQVEEALAGNVSFVLDSGSINNSYTKRIIGKIREATARYRVKLVHVKTPLLLCLDRNKDRERKVPAEEVVAKACREDAQFKKLRVLVDEVYVEAYFTNKNIFLDMDGVLAAQTTLPKINGEIDFVNSEIFRYQDPVTPVIEKCRKLHNAGHKLRILSATPTSIAMEEKHEWLDIHVPFIGKEDRFFVNQGRHKAEMLEGLRRKFRLEKCDITLVDDYHNTLYAVLDRHMQPMHVSEFLVYDFQPTTTKLEPKP